AEISSVAIVDEMALGGVDQLAVIEVRRDEEAADRYLLTVAGDELDGLKSESLRARVFELVTGGRLEPSDSKVLGAEQSNSSLLYFDREGKPAWVLKLFRRLMAGENPEHEILSGLNRLTSFRHVPQVVGEIRRGDTTLAVAEEFVANLGDGWEYALRGLRAGDDHIADVSLLGRRTAELHAALALAFGTEVIGDEDARHWIARAKAGAHAPNLAGYREALAPWITHLEQNTSGVEATRGLDKIRLHGDYHLGQVLKTRDDFVIFDFEGEPARPMAERRRRGCALQDVAGMLRSFSYAAVTAERGGWDVSARAAFLAAYRETVHASAPRLVPGDADGFARALGFFEREKAVYELSYELAHRPGWASIPLQAITTW
ncbi:MAG TPA: hypothetical protein VIC32_02675, partial [Terriglobales bacterium]